MMEYRRSRVCGVESGSWVGERILPRTVGMSGFGSINAVPLFAPPSKV